MKKHHRLNARGISHILVPLTVILIVAIGGTTFLVASHADPIGSRSGDPNIRTAKMSVKKTSGPFQSDGEWCNKYVYKYKVKTSGKVDNVQVKFIPKAGYSGYPSTYLTHRGASNWTGTSPGYTIYTSKKGGRGTTNVYGSYQVEASYGSQFDTKTLPEKKVRIN